MMLLHTEFLSRLSPVAARGLTESYGDIISRLAGDPYQFPFADEMDMPDIPPETYRKCLFDKRYKALFFIEGNSVFTDTVIDCRQENKTLFNNS